MRIALTGPASPVDAAHLMNEQDRARALLIPGYRGVPVTELAGALIRAGHEVEVITTAAEIAETVELSGPNFRMALAPMRPRAKHRAFDHFAQEREVLLELLTASRADVVHANWTYEFALAAQASKKPLVVTAHDAPVTVMRQVPDAYRAIRMSMAWRVRRRLRELVTVSPYLALRWRREMLFRGRIDVVPNIAPYVEPGMGVTVAYRGAQVSVVSVGDATRRKNIPTLLRAFALCRSSRPEIVLDLIGPGLGPEEDLARWARRHSLSSGVRFRGRLERAELFAVMGGASVMAHPSHEECHPIALIEAMGLGVPIVAGENSGGVPWTLDDGRAGMLVDVRDPVALARGLLTVLDQPELGTSLIDNAAHRVESMFRADVVSSQYLEIYRRVVELYGSR